MPRARTATSQGSATRGPIILVPGHEVEERPRVLVVNDDPEVLHSRCAVLNRLGFSTVPALGIPEAEHVAAGQPFGAVLVDATNVSFHHAIHFCQAVKHVRPALRVILLVSSHHVISEDDCPDVVVVRDHPERMLPKITAAIRGEDVPVDDKMAEDPS